MCAGCGHNVFHTFVETEVPVDRLGYLSQPDVATPKQFLSILRTIPRQFRICAKTPRGRCT